MDALPRDDWLRSVLPNIRRLSIARFVLVRPPVGTWENVARAFGRAGVHHFPFEDVATIFHLSREPREVTANPITIEERRQHCLWQSGRNEAQVYRGERWIHEPPNLTYEEIQALLNIRQNLAEGETLFLKPGKQISAREQFVFRRLTDAELWTKASEHPSTAEIPDDMPRDPPVLPHPNPQHILQESSGTADFDPNSNVYDPARSETRDVTQSPPPTQETLQQQVLTCVTQKVGAKRPAESNLFESEMKAAKKRRVLEEEDDSMDSSSIPNAQRASDPSYQSSTSDGITLSAYRPPDDEHYYFATLFTKDGTSSEHKAPSMFNCDGRFRTFDDPEFGTLLLDSMAPSALPNNNNNDISARGSDIQPSSHYSISRTTGVVNEYRKTAEQAGDELYNGFRDIFDEWKQQDPPKGSVTPRPTQYQPNAHHRPCLYNGTCSACKISLMSDYCAKNVTLA